MGSGVGSGRVRKFFVDADGRLRKPETVESARCRMEDFVVDEADEDCAEDRFLGSVAVRRDGAEGGGMMNEKWFT